ncbi:alpha/beta hydrolase [Treponema sp. OttesenSCG-928-L16]|nr:alpha/beta hydrolase [Treponema sp. OttesenSCG-928-L16]
MIRKAALDTIILMDEMIRPFDDSGSSFRMWPDLAQYGRLLSLGPSGESLFFYDSGGSGGTPLICIHGLGDEADSWRHLFPLIAGTRRVIALDLPGFGRSVPARGSSLRLHAQAVLTLLEMTGPAVLAGSSMGAAAAELAAFRKGGLVKGLVLLDGCLPVSGGISPGLLFMALPFLGKKWYRAFRKDGEGAYRSLEPYYADMAALSPRDRQFLRERVMARVSSPSQERAYFSSLRSFIWNGAGKKSFYSRGAASYTGKMLLIWGEKDGVIPVSATDRLRSLKPAAGFAVIGGAGHLPHQERPEVAADALLPFLESLDREAGQR